MKEIRKIGWIGKNVDLVDQIDIEYRYMTNLYVIELAKVKGKKSIWGTDWPPKKVEIIIREVE